MSNLSTKWMDMELKNPFVLASLTLFSKVELQSHIRFFDDAIKNGASAVILPSVNPSNFNKNNDVIIEVKPIETGFKKNDYMGFTVLGPPEANIVSVQYGFELAKTLKSKYNESKVIASVANMGTENKFIDAVKLLEKTGVDAIELNFSCPNILTEDEDTEVTNLTMDLLKRIREIINIPISLKLSPNTDHTEILQSISDEIDSVTISNAFLGLMPPRLECTEFTAFDKSERWAPTGIYGPQERMITYYNLFRYGEIAHSKGIQVSCVGGILNEEQVTQAIMLGADTVQFSSVIAWKGMTFFNKAINYIQKFMENYNILLIDELRGKVLPFITSGVSTVKSYDKIQVRSVDEDKCKRCKPCSCVNRLCVAFYQDETFAVGIKQELCSGCGWCSVMCRNNAIIIESI